MHVLNELVWGASCGGSHSLGRIFIFRRILASQICDPASAGLFEGRQIWEIRFNELVRWESYEGDIAWAA